MKGSVTWCFHWPTSVESVERVLKIPLVEPSSQLGFTPIALEAGYVARKRQAPRTTRARASSDAPPALEARAANNQVYFPSGGRGAPSSPPQTVTCNVLVHALTTVTSIYTAPTYTVTAQAKTISTTRTSTTTTTTTSVLADATTLSISTVTSVTTSTTTLTTSTSTTLTNTVVLPVATYYAQCAPNNIINSAHGVQIGNIGYSPSFFLASASVTDSTGYGCCAKCAQTPTCAGYGQYPGGSCYYILTDGRCDGSQTFGDSYNYFATPGQVSYTIGNGQCGALGAISGPPPA